MTKQDKAKDAQYEQLVTMFIDGFLDEAPDAADFGVSDERRDQMVLKAVLGDDSWVDALDSLEGVAA